MKQVWKILLLIIPEEVHPVANTILCRGKTTLDFVAEVTCDEETCPRAFSLQIPIVTDLMIFGENLHHQVHKQSVAAPVLATCRSINRSLILHDEPLTPRLNPLLLIRLDQRKLPRIHISILSKLSSFLNLKVPHRLLSRLPLHQLICLPPDNIVILLLCLLALIQILFSFLVDFGHFALE